jgi:hypothetical protein
VNRGAKHYTADTIDWIAVYDATTMRCFYVPAVELGAGKAILDLRLAEARNGQQQRIRFADDYRAPEIRQSVLDPLPAGMVPRGR